MMGGSAVMTLIEEQAGRSASVVELMNPACVAVVGASEDRRKFGGRILHLLNNQGFRGRILPVNPVRAEILGHQAYRCIMDLPQAPDLVILAIPRDLVVQAVSDCGDIGAKGVIVVASGFSESGDEGARLEQQLLAVAREKAVRIIGPNCVGVVSPAHGFSLATTVSLVDRAPLPGHIGLISQSGAVMGTMIDRGISQNVGFSHCISVGNQADVDFCDFVDFMIDDPSTHVICTYVEGIKRPDLFLRAAGRAQAASKPWLLMKSGRTEAGAASAFSHTASLASNQAILDGVCRQFGILQVDDVEGMLVAASGWNKYPDMRVRSVAVLSPSGGGCTIAADRLSDIGVPLARFSDRATAALAPLFDGPVRNPVDIGAANDGAAMGYVETIHRAALQDEQADLVLSVVTNAPVLTEVGKMIGDAARAVDQPLLAVVMPGGYAEGAREQLAAAGVLCTDSLDAAMRAIGAWHAWARRPAASRAVRPQGLPVPEPVGAGRLDEAGVKRLLGRYGIRVNEGRVAATPDEAAAAAQALRAPYVVKVISEDISHKTEVGGVRLGLADGPAVRAAAVEMAAQVRQKRPDARVDGFLVQEFVRGELELLLGLKQDAQFGVTLAVGAGGTLAEILRDVLFAPCPVSRESAGRMLERLKLAPLFGGVRGGPPLDVAAVVDTMVRLSWLGHDLRDSLQELDINPVLVLADGAGCVAVDGRALSG